VTEQEIIEFLMDAGCIKVSSIAPGDTTGTNCTYDFTEDGEMLRLTINGLYQQQTLRRSKEARERRKGQAS